ncbi:MAG TPA: PorV/PorQ family protein [Balneolaceae bacterium]|nr:PorV/PorQ family protein [Balneolaceae bacterium]
MRKILLPIALLLLFLFPCLTAAQDTGTGMDFLNIGPTPRVLSLSEAVTSRPSGVASIYSNPSLLAREPRSVVDVAYTLWIANVNNQFAGVNFARERSAIAFSVYNSSSDGFEARDRPGPSAGNFSIGYISLAGAYALQLGSFSAGVSGQYLREEIFQYRASGYSVTAGASLSMADERILIGSALQNIGRMQSLDNHSSSLPSSFNLGLSAQVLEISSPGANDFPMVFTLTGDWHYYLSERLPGDYTRSDQKRSFYSLALSLLAADLFVLETGYRFGNTERPFSAGAGLLLDPLRINYAFVPFSTGFGSVHSFGLQYYF